MSLFSSMTVTCPNCLDSQSVSGVGSVNADRRPDLREAILDDTFQVMTCENCGGTFRLEPGFNYLEVGRGHWIAAMPGRQMPDYLEVEDRVTQSFAASYGDRALPAAQEIGKGLSARVTFGWPAMREKLVISGADLDDVTVEMLKLDLLRRLPSAPLAPGTELRLVAADDDMLSFAWIDTVSEEVAEQFGASRALYDSIAANPDGWAPIRAQLTDGPFVDMQKLYMGEGRAAAAG